MEDVALVFLKSSSRTLVAFSGGPDGPCRPTRDGPGLGPGGPTGAGVDAHRRVKRRNQQGTG